MWYNSSAAAKYLWISSLVIGVMRSGQRAAAHLYSFVAVGGGRAGGCAGVVVAVLTLFRFCKFNLIARM